MVGDGVIMCQQLHNVSAPYGIVHFELVISIGNVGSFLGGKTKTYRITYQTDIVIYLFLVLFPPAWAQGYGGLFPVSPASVVLWI